MGFRDRLKKGGGFWHGVDMLITNVQFTTEPEFGGDSARPEQAEGAASQLWVKVTARVDGQSTEESTHLQAGGDGDKVVISEDEHSITTTESGVQGVWGNSAFGQFYASAVDSELPDFDPVDGEEEGTVTLDFSNLIGTRVRTEQVKDEDAMKKMAEKVKKTPKKYPKWNDKGQRKGKDGKFYDLRTLKVVKVYSTGNAVDATAASAPAKGAKSAAAKKATKAATPPPPVEAEEVDIPGLAEDSLVTILNKAKNKTVTKTQMNVEFTKLLNGNPNRDDARTYAFNDTNLANWAKAGLIKYDKAKATVTLAE